MSQDLQTFSYSMTNESGEKMSIPFLKKKLQYQIDNNNSTNYSRNEVQFETTSLSNNGKWMDFKNGFMSVPLVMTLTRDAGHAISADDAKQLLQMKASNLSIIDSIQIEANGVSVVQQTRNIVPLLIFKQHSTLGLNDLELHSQTMGYQKHSSEDWSYVTAEGLHNDSTMDKKFYHEEKNAGVQSVADFKASGSNYQQVSVDGLTHVFYYDCIIRLRDLPFFEKMPLIRGALMRITLTLNQGDSSITVSGGNKTTVSSSLSGSAFPVIRKSGAEVADYVEDISVKVCENGNFKHQKKQCRLYLPAYTFENSFESQYLALGSKKVLYDDVYFTKVQNVGGEFTTLLSNGLSRMKRLIIVPVLHRTANGTLQVDPVASPFTADGVGTCSPYRITNFNVKISTSNVYENSISYKYEHYLNEMAGADGVNAGMEDGMSSGLISLKDYEANYGYLVVNLSRRHQYDNNVSLSVEINGTVSSGKALDLLCYIEYEKDISFDVTTGQVL